MLIGAAAGGKDTLQPLRGLVPANGVAGAGHASFQRIKSVSDLERELNKARAAGQAGDAGFLCRLVRLLQGDGALYLQRSGASSPQMDRFILLQADVTANDAEDQALMQDRFGLPGPPAILFFDPSGREIANHRLVGFTPAEPFAAHLRQVAP